MTDCHCNCDSGTCALADAPIQVGREYGCQVYSLDFTSEGDIKLGLDEDGNLTGDIIISPDAGNILSAETDGLLLALDVIASESGSTDASWTETSAEFRRRQETTLTLPEGRWFVHAHWRADVKLATAGTSDQGAKFVSRLTIDNHEGLHRQWRWNDTEGVLLTFSGGHTIATVGDSFSVSVKGDQTIDVGIETFIDPTGSENQVDFTGSRVVAWAVRKYEQ